MKVFQVVVLGFFIIIAIIAVLIFAGILPGFRPDTAKTTTNLVLWGLWSEKNSQIMSFLEDFNRTYQGVYEITYIGKDINNLSDQFLNELARGNAPDLIIIPDDLIIKHRNKLQTIPYQSFSIRDFDNTYLPIGQIFRDPPGSPRAGTFAFPLLIDPLLMYYNPNYYANLGLVKPPETWTELIKQLNTLNEIDEKRNILKSGLAMGEVANILNFQETLLLLFFQAGNSVVFNHLGEYSANLGGAAGDNISSSALAALNFFLEFSDPRRSNYSWNRSLSRDRDMFLAGRLANFFGFASDLGKLYSLNPNLKIDAVLIPQSDKAINKITYGQVYGLAVPSASRHQTAAFAVANIIANDWPTKYFIKASNLIPARRNLMNLNPEDPLQNILYRSAIIAQSWLNPDKESSRIIFQMMIDDVNTGRRTYQEAIANANLELTKLIKQNK